MTLSLKLKKIRDLLIDLDGTTDAGPPVYHYEKDGSAGERYIVWAETYEDSAYSSDNIKREQVIRGTIDMFTHTEFDTLADNIQTALDAADGVSWRLDTVYYEDDTGFIHYTWEFWVW